MEEFHVEFKILVSNYWLYMGPIALYSCVSMCVSVCYIS